jgi:hypothetical protein
LLDDDVVTVPAGWYPDPMGLPQLRWWDNHAWTEFTSAARTPLIMQDDPKLAYADDELPSRRSQRTQREQMPGRGNDNRRQNSTTVDLASALRQLEPPMAHHVELSHPAPVVNDTVPPAGARDAAFGNSRRPAGGEDFTGSIFENSTFPSSTFDSSEFHFHMADFAASSRSAGGTATNYGRRDYAGSPFAETGPAVPRADVHTPLAYTPFVWIIAMVPLIQLVAILLVVSAMDVSAALPIVAAIWLGPYIGVIPLAIADRRQLASMGHRHLAHWAWSLLTAPGYLLARAVASTREYGKGLAPLLVWASLSLLQIVSIIAVPGILISAMPSVFSEEVENSIEASAAVVGRTLEVTCPDTPPVQIRATYTCSGLVPATGDVNTIVVSLQRANGWIDWRVESQVWGEQVPTRG